LTNTGDSQSLGAPNDGRLVRGITAPPHRGYIIRNPERSYGTEETIDNLVAAFKAVLARYPSAARVRLHDISLPHGGPMDDHRSHQSGRDVDLSYYQRRCSRSQGCPFVSVSRSQLAAGPQWTLFEHWLRKDVVDQIFVDYSLQSALFEEARKSGATPSQLAVWFQYPRGRRAPPGIIRHYRNHRNHLHVRFRCPPGDEACR
jgi:murein endopeptidase